jgi:hypothetical protein
MMDTKQNRDTFQAYSHSKEASAASSEEIRPVRTIHPPRQLAARAYDGVIEDSQMLAFDWRRSDANPDGLCLRLAVLVYDEQGPAHVFDCIDANHEDRLYGVYRAVGLPAPVDPVAESSSLTGQRVRVALKNIIPRQGRHAGMAKAVVSTWIPCR